MQLCTAPLNRYRYSAVAIGMRIIGALVRFISLLTLPRAAVCRHRSDLDDFRYKPVAFSRSLASRVEPRLWDSLPLLPAKCWLILRQAG